MIRIWVSLVDAIYQVKISHFKISYATKPNATEEFEVGQASNLTSLQGSPCQQLDHHVRTVDKWEDMTRDTINYNPILQ